MANPFASPAQKGYAPQTAPPSIPARTSKQNTDSDGEQGRTLLVKQEAFVYKIPPQTKAVGWKATDWNLDNPDWKGRMRLVSMGKGAMIRLEDKAGDNKLYAACPIETYPGPSVQSVADSSRYFVIKVTENGKNAHLGLGFADRADSFDVNTTLHDHFKGILVEEKIELEKDEPLEKLDLAFKQGETIKVSINIPKKSNRAKSAGARLAGGGLPPPPGPTGSIPAPPSPALARLNLGPRPGPAAAGGSNQWIQF